jgi:hypothetical protein
VDGRPVCRTRPAAARYGAHRWRWWPQLNDRHERPVRAPDTRQSVIRAPSLSTPLAALFPSAACLPAPSSSGRNQRVSSHQAHRSLTVGI